MKRLLLTIASVALLGIGTSSARADQWNKRTVMTLGETIQVPNKVLEPGTYVVKLLDSPSNRHIVQIFNAEETELLTTILAIPNYRLEPRGETVFSFWETPPGQPKALRAWFYPGDNFGQEFAYPKTEAVAIARVAHADVPSVEAQQPAELETAPVIEVAPEAAVVEPLPAPIPAPVETAKEVAPIPVAELPKTASPYPFIGLLGLLSLVAFAVVRVVRTS